MRSPNKNRSRNKNNRKNNAGNVVNRVFDSAGPEGKVRGTPAQVIEKYQTLARDAQLSGDPVAAENFLQHAEHYVRMLAEANAQIEAQAARQREQQEARDAERSDTASESGDTGSRGEGESDSGLVETPEGEQPQPRRSRRRRVNADGAQGGEAQPTADPGTVPEQAAE
ncbi:MAG: DUF4167 domain-containing protein [Rubricella sp.]